MASLQQGPVFVLVQQRMVLGHRGCFGGESTSDAFNSVDSIWNHCVDAMEFTDSMQSWIWAMFVAHNLLNKNMKTGSRVPGKLRSCAQWASGKTVKKRDFECWANHEALPSSGLVEKP